MKGLLIAEKPDLMKKIFAVYRANRDKYDYTLDFASQVGHLVTLMFPKELDPENYGHWYMKNYPHIFPYKYKIKSQTKNVYEEIKKKLEENDYDFIVHAGDPDQEGELLVHLTLNKIGNKLPIKRFWTNDLSEKSIHNALLNLRDDAEFRRLLNAALLRQHIDYQYGMNYAPVISLQMNDTCKVGRVKAYIIYISATREIEIINYVETVSYKPMFLYRDLEFVYPEGKNTPEEACRLNPVDSKARVLEVNIETKNKKPEKLFKLSSLQAVAYKEFKMNAADTLTVTQSLYEKKMVSYPRTDCEYVSTETDLEGIKNKIIGNFSIDPALIVKTGADLKKDKSYCNDEQVGKESHTAIIPTGEVATGLNDKETKLYDLICRRFLAIFSRNKKTKHIKVTASSDLKPDFIYEYTEKSDIDPGYEFVANISYERPKESGIEFVKDMILDPVKFTAKECKSQPPKRYNSGSLIKALDNPEDYEDESGSKIKYAVGTPATRANIIQECIENGYIEDKKGVYHATQKAISVYNNYKNAPIFDPVATGKLEEILIKVRNGEFDAKQAQDIFLNDMINGVNSIKTYTVTPLKEKGGLKVIGKCPHCQSDVVTGKYGVFCKNKCGMFLSKAMGKDLTEKQITDLLAGKQILVKGLHSKDPTKKDYDAYLKPTGVTSFTFTRQDGTKTTGYGFSFDISFPKKKKAQA